MTKKFEKKKIFVIICCICIMFAAGFFVIQNTKLPVKAAADSSSTFSMIDGMRLRIGEQSDGSFEPEYKIRFEVTVTDEMKNALSQPTEEIDMGLGGAYIVSPYYLCITRSNPNDVNDVYREYYHIDPEHANVVVNQLSFDNTNNVGLVFPYGGDFTVEYVYSCSYVKITRVQIVGKPPSDEVKIYTISSTNTVQRSIAYVAGKVLENESDRYNEEQIRFLQHLAGVYTSDEEFTVNLKYKTMLSYGNIQTVTEQYNISTLYLLSADMCYSSISSIKGINSFADYNVIYSNGYSLVNGVFYPTDVRIFLQADGYSYSYDEESKTGTLEIVYKDFNYSSFTICIRDNDLTDGQYLTAYIYFTDVTISDGIATMRLPFMSSDDDSSVVGIVNQCFNAMSWLFELSADDFSVNNVPEGFDVNVTDSEVSVSFPVERENELMNLSISAIAEIVPDFECNVNINYVELGYADGEITETEKTIEETVMYSYYARELINSSSFYGHYGDTVENGISLDVLNGESYFIYNGIECVSNGDNSFNINVQYKYNTLFRIEDNFGNVYYHALTKSSLMYQLTDFNINVPTGYRIAEIYSDDTKSVTIDFIHEAPLGSTITVNVSTKEKNIIPFYVTLSDYWFVKINYLAQYKQSCFAEKKQFSGEIRVKDYENIYEISADDIKSILGMQSLDILGLSTVKDITVSFDGDSTYVIDLSYTETALRKMSYNGEVEEIKVPLTSYADWCNTYGNDWTILFLNNPQNKVFQYTNDIERENLYGFFSVAVFKERVTDLNYYFQDYSADGCKTVFESREVRGSDIYKFFDGNYFFMALCEVFNDDNAIYYSYFFYLDGTSDLSYLALNGADSADDTSSALENRVEDVLDDIKNFLDNTFGKGSLLGTIVRIVLIVTLGIIVLWFLSWVIRMLKKIFRKDTSQNRKKKR